jgi:uncharacterized repeat protein (TIGR01451 family)
MKKIIILIIAFSFLGLNLFGQQNQNVGISGSSLSPAPTTMGGSFQACFNFTAPNGVTLNSVSGEVIEINVCFNKITPASISVAAPIVQYGMLGSQNFIDWTYISAVGGNCWQGVVDNNITSLSNAQICFNGLSASVSATVQEANAAAGIGFSVNLVPHSRDPTVNDLDDFEEIYTFTVDNTVDLAVTKTVDNLYPRVGDLVTFKIIAENLGNDPATGVVVNDVLPTGYSYVSDFVTSGTWNAPNWSLGNLVSGAADTLTIVATVNATGSFVNIATISGTEVDINTGNNTSSATIFPYSPSIALVKTGSLHTAKDSITYTFTVYNTGDSLLTDIEIFDSKLGGIITISPDSLNSGESAVVTVGYAVLPGEKIVGRVVNTATVSGNPPSGAAVIDISGSAIDNDDETVVIIPPCPPGERCLTARAVRIK